MDQAFAGDGFTVSRVVVGPLDNNAYLIRCNRTGKGILVDAADEPEALLQLVEGTAVLAVVTTHGHWDHHQAAKQTAATLGAPVLVHPLDAAMTDGSFNDLEMGSLRIGDVTATTLHTPGHTPGSSCIYLDGVVFTGDTLFPGGPGATRFEHSSFETIIESIVTHLFSLEDDTVVLPGHGEATTIGTERGQLQTWVDRGW